jgi:hypothetical protein
MMRQTGRIEYYILALILVLGLVARFRYLTAIEHNVDHAYPIWQAMTTLDEGEFPVIGQGTSVLFANPPMTGYLYLPVVGLTRSPIGVYMFVIALNTLGIYFAYRAGASVVGSRWALIVAGLMAVNPWIIEYSRTTWVQSLMPFFVGAVAWLLWPVFLGRTHHPVKRIILGSIMLTVFAHTYLLAFFLIAPVVVLAIIFRQHIPWRGVAVGVGIFALLAVPYGLGLLDDLDTVQAEIDTFGEAEATINPEALYSALRLITGVDYEVSRGMLAPAGDADMRQTLSRFAHWPLVVLLIVGMVSAIWALRRPGHERDAAIVLFVWWALPIIAMTYTGNNVHNFYQLLGIPAGAVFIAWGISAFFKPSNRLLIALGILFLPYAALMLTNSARWYQETAALPTDFGYYAMPLDPALTVGDTVREHLPDDGVAFIQAEAWIINSLSGAVFPAVPDTRAPGFYTLPVYGGVYISENNLGTLPPKDLPGIEPLLMMMAVDGYDLAVHRLVPAGEAALPGDVINVPSQQGLTLHRAQLIQEGELYMLMTAWRVDAPPDAVADWILQPFIHAYDANGERVINTSGEGLPGYRWSVGDIHIYYTPLPVPDAPAWPLTLQVGQFDGAKGAGLTFLPPDADPVGAVTLPFVMTD